MKFHDFGFDVLKMAMDALNPNAVKDRLEIHTNEEIKQSLVQNSSVICLEIFK